jgi:threonine dehydratase
MNKINQIPTLQDIQTVHERIKPYLNYTPILESQTLNQIIGSEVFLKCENLQKVGAFKMRGALSAVSFLTKEEQKNGVATQSSGNHAQALALTAKTFGLKAYIAMPHNAPTSKRNATAGYGAVIRFCEPTLASREATLAEIIAETGAYYIPPYDDYHIIAGQATAAKELLEEIPNLDIVMAPIGGGGLMSGTSLICKYINPNIRVIGTEPANVNDAYRSFYSGSLQSNSSTQTVADGLRTQLSTKTFEIIKNNVDEILTCSEEDMLRAMFWVWERMKILIEPSAAVPLACLLQEKEKFKGKKIGIIISGGNIDWKDVAQWMQELKL